MTDSLDTRMQLAVHRPGNREKAFFLVSGIVVSVPLTLFVSNLTDYAQSFVFGAFFAQLLSSVLIAPVIEEFAKAYPLFYRHGETERSIFTLGFLVGLGFGISEFFLYVLLLQAPIPIRLPALLFHATNASITAYGIARKRTLSFYLLAVFLHLSNNLFAELGLLWFIGGVAATVASYLISWRLWRRTSETLLD